MKSILNDVNRLEKAWDLFQRLAVACNEYDVYKTSPSAYNRFRAELCKANAFIEKYGELSSHKPDLPNSYPDPN